MRSCFNIPDPYKNVYEAIHMQCENICEREEKLAETARKQQRLEQEKQQEQQNRQNELASQLKNIQTYLNFALFRLDGFSPDETRIAERPYNTAVLQQLLMKMNMGLPGCAESLYYEAAGQQRGIEKQQRSVFRTDAPAADDFSQDFIKDQDSRFNAVFRNNQPDRFEERPGPVSLEQGIISNVSTKQDGRTHGDNAAMLTIRLPRPGHASPYRIDRFPFSFQDYTLSFPLEFERPAGAAAFYRSLPDEQRYAGRVCHTGRER